MDETSEEHSETANKPLHPASSSPLLSPVCSSTYTWLPVDPWMSISTEKDHQPGVQWSPTPPFYEELYCTSHTSSTPVPLVPLAGALLTSSSQPLSDVVKQGYLGKLERSHRRYFVLRGGSHLGLSRLEWYKSQEKFTAAEKTTGVAALFGSGKQGLVYLRCCLGVSRVSSSRKGHTVTLYAKDQTVVLVVEDQREQEEWYLAVKKLMEEERTDEEHGEGLDEDDDGYCTLPPAAFFKEVWPVTVKPQGLGSAKSLVGESRLCLTATSLILIRVSACNDLPSVTIPLLSVRRFGHLDGSFFLELGRSAPNGPGEIWMEAKDRGNPAVAQNIHEVIRDTVRDLRALPDFNRSPTSSSNQLQSLLASKRCRPKYRDKPVNVRPLGSRLSLPPRTPETQTQSYIELRKPDKPEHGSSPSSTSPLKRHQSSTPETCGYMEMKTEHPNPEKEEHRSVTASEMASWEQGEEEEKEKGLGYMMMSPQAGPSSFKLPQDDYMNMASPHKHKLLVYTSFQTSFNSSTSDGYSPVRPPHHQTSECNLPDWPLTSVEADQSKRSNSCSSQPYDEDGQEQSSAEQGHHPAGSRVTSTPVKNEKGAGDITNFPENSPGGTSPVPGTGKSSPLQAAPDQSIRRSRLFLCLPSCLKAEDRS
ncbi:insulin receptor substrate 1-like [Notolabrus celidotus]|uniref:insulin receptor substrate 1-like n=1 Tax=Notolabrus celidotus TaxID=1203425 RepID=UPI00148FC04E|nr:insulin receptor substrate 1-like [Notolabrus celidotus]